MEDDDGNRNLLELYRRVDILRWFLDDGEKEFPSIAVVAKYLGRVTSSAYQERVFSTAGFISRSRRSRKNRRYYELSPFPT
ncbi:LOW QUALITY PROTEIN: Hypothetical protein PHPALM_810 [Phytophthora palmivora]|uniref:HAT C-terminal dimerisation domain-containing protein n=1 Tax=Phytophthora palmivora TaxID=4796 RepID=A0A2P4YTX3_9STRA|nr:LOW QUALITY PROTEIN: Hypothetical protein PHPALM_810 [Phytophthora palmivora]